MKKNTQELMDDSACEVPRWQQLKSKLQNHNPEEFKEELDRTSDRLVIDVRTAKEAHGTTLADAIVMDYLGSTFLDEMDALDKEKTYFIYCQSGRRSVRTCTMMSNAGFANLHHLDGGLNAWNQHFGKK